MAPLCFDGQLKRFDITIPEDNFPTWESLAAKLRGWCTKFVFQKEKGLTGYVHWQCRVNMIHSRTAAAMHSDVLPVIPGHWSVTSNGVHAGPKAFCYVMKECTRIDGPWDDTNLIEERPPLTRQLENFMKHPFYPWQQTVHDIAQVYEERFIHIIKDTVGSVGKSVFLEFLEYQGIAFDLPPLREMEDIMEFCHSFPPKSCYIIDMPRGMKKDKLGSFYSGIESIKNGLTYDKRYSGKKRRMNRPVVIIFTNDWPQISLLSLDRWKFYDMQVDMTLKIVDPLAIL